MARTKGTELKKRRAMDAAGDAGSDSGDGTESDEREWPGGARADDPGEGSEDDEYDTVFMEAEASYRARESQRRAGLSAERPSTARNCI